MTIDRRQLSCFFEIRPDNGHTMEFYLPATLLCLPVLLHIKPATFLCLPATFHIKPVMLLCLPATFHYKPVMLRYKQATLQCKQAMLRYKPALLQYKQARLLLLTCNVPLQTLQCSVTNKQRCNTNPPPPPPPCIASCLTRNATCLTRKAAECANPLALWFRAGLVCGGRLQGLTTRISRIFRQFNSY